MGKVHAKATVEGEVAAEGTLRFALVDPPKSALADPSKSALAQENG